MCGGETEEVEGPEPFDFRGEKIIPRSRTFIPARLEEPDPGGIRVSCGPSGHQTPMNPGRLPPYRGARNI